MIYAPRKRISQFLLGTMAWLALAQPSFAAGAATAITFKIVKQTAGNCQQPPELKLLSAADQWKLHDGPSWSGENPREVFFTIESNETKAELPKVSVRLAGAVPVRVIVGKQDVPFARDGDNVVFTLVRDTHNAMLLNQLFTDSEGGLPIHVYHNWMIRQDGQYRGKPAPEVEVRAVLNYLVAAREALKLMGGAGPKDEKPYKGDITLMSFEVACARGHNDYPPHIHIMLWVPGYVGGEIPHFYMDAAGKITHNQFDVLGDPSNKFPERAAVIADKRKRGGQYGPGRPCPLYDLEGRLALQLTITPEGGLLLARDQGEPYLLIGDVQGAGEAVLVKQGNQTLARAQVVDNAERGAMQVSVDYFRNGRVERTLRQTQSYDPFTGMEPKPDTRKK